MIQPIAIFRRDAFLFRVISLRSVRTADTRKKKIKWKERRKQKADRGTLNQRIVLLSRYLAILDCPDGFINWCASRRIVIGFASSVFIPQLILQLRNERSKYWKTLGCDVVKYSLEFGMAQHCTMLQLPMTFDTNLFSQILNIIFKRTKSSKNLQFLNFLIYSTIHKIKIVL